jgi:hypothetical protein
MALVESSILYNREERKEEEYYIALIPKLK